MCVPNGPLFQRCQVYDWPPFFSTKSIWMTQFFWIPMWKAPLFWHPGIRTYFSLRDFSRLLVLLVFNELTFIFVYKPVINGYKISKGSIWKGQHFGWANIWMGPFFQRPGIWMGVDFEIPARTPVPKLPLSYTPPPAPEADPDQAASDLGRHYLPMSQISTSRFYR